MKLVRDVLQVKGHATLEATTAEDGIALARERMPDLVLMDIQLPGMNGIDALRVLRARSGDRAHPGDRGDRIGDAAGPQAHHRSRDSTRYIGKPISLAEFLKAVNAHLERGRPKP